MKHDTWTSAVGILVAGAVFALLTRGGCELGRWEIIGYGAFLAFGVLLVRPEAGKALAKHLPWGDK